MKKDALAFLGLIVAALVLMPRNAGAATGGALAALSYLGQNGLPRGMRNNNPGNIRINSTAWQGKIPVNQNTDKSFEQFQTYAYGVRAMIKNLLTYYKRDGLTTIHGIISKWAPASENDTAAYVQKVSRSTGFGPNQKINLESIATMRSLVLAMTAVENGRAAVTPELFNYAWNLI
mgnify:FL=1